MGTPAPRFPMEAFGALGRLKNAGPEAEALLDDATRELDKWRKNGREHFGRVRHVIELLYGDPEAAEYVGLDAFIEQAEQTEEQLAKRSADILKRIKRIKNVIGLIWPDLVPKVEALIREIDEGIVEQLEFDCDARWELMKIRAEYLPSAPIGKVRGKPTDLKAYTNSLKN